MVLMIRKSKKHGGPHPGTDAYSISEAEWAVMELLWSKSPRTSAELCVSLEKTRRWKRATVMTLLSRLISKGIVLTEGEGRRWQYAPAVPREKCVAQETRGFLDRLFKGALLPMVAHCIEHQKLSAHELSELRALLNQPKRKSESSSSSNM
jgi:BlaI family transcriptional regulator, penicillinase repressor